MATDTTTTSQTPQGRVIPEGEEGRSLKPPAPKGLAALPPGEEGELLKRMKDLIRSSAGNQEKLDERLKQMEKEAAGRFKRTPGVYSVDQSLETIGEADMIRSVAAYQGMEFVDLPNMGLNHDEVRNLIRELGGELVRTYRVLPLKTEDDGTLIVAIADPLDVTIGDDLQMLTERKVKTVVANESDILDYIEMIWGVGDTDLQRVLKEADDAEGGTLEDVAKDGLSVEIQDDPEELAAQPPVIRLVNSYLMQAIKDHASDLHFEPYRGMVRIRYRVDGHLRELPDPPKHMQLGLVSRLKVLANMNIAETRVPQDGRIRLVVKGREVDLRVSSLPTVHGESIVMRILDKAMMMLTVDALGFSPEHLESFHEVIHRPNGITLVCGPTGCGKTTTLYAALGAVNDPGVKIITTEEPVEYQLPGLVQVNINTAIGLTFAACLRSILRQDPDIILVGEIRDVETAEIAIQAALTGHMVFSTVHANSAAACATRLVDMGVEPFLITSTMQAIIAQRLVRTVCKTCGETYAPKDTDLADFGLTVKDVPPTLNFRKGVGCDDCSYSGYKGRLGIYEMLVFDDDIRDLILERATTDEVHLAAVQRGMETMRVDGWNKISAGITTFEEVARQTPKESEAAIRAEMLKVLNPGAAPAALPAATAKDAAPESPLESEAAVRKEGLAPSTQRGKAIHRIAAPWEEEAAAKTK